MIKVGILGFPFSGKKTFMKLLGILNGIDNVEGRVMTKVPDKRLERLAEIYKPKKITPVTMEFVYLGSLSPEFKEKERIAVLVETQNVDVVLIILRAFTSEIAPPVKGYESPFKQLEFIMEEFLLRDLAILENRIEKLKNAKRKLTNVEEQELKTVERIKEHLETYGNLNYIQLKAEEIKTLQGYSLMAFKKKVVLVNLGDDQLDGYKDKEKVLELVGLYDMGYVELPVGIAVEILQLDEDERKIFIEEYRVKDFHIEDLMKEIFNATGMIVFFTAGEKEVRAWEIKKGANAVDAAGAIHSDMARGFIRAEVFSFEDLDREGSVKVLREKGLIHVVGKDHPIKDGDVVFIRFNV